MMSDNAGVLQVIQAPQRRGAEVFAVQLSVALRRMTCPATVVSLFPGDEAFMGQATEAGVWGGALGSRRPVGPLSWAVVRALGRRIAAAGYPVVQANGSATLKYLAITRALSRGRWPLVYRTIGMPSYWQRDVLRMTTYRWLFGQADLVVAVCRRAAEELREQMGIPAHRVRVIPNGVDSQPFLSRSALTRAGVRAQAGVLPDDVVLIHVGSLSAEKNHAVLVRTVAAMRDAGKRVRLWLVGDGPERNAIRAMIDHAGLQTFTWMAGARSDVPELLAGADLLVLPSLTEGMPAAVIEAGLSGLPVVAYSVGGIDEVVYHERTGLLVAAGDEPGFRAAVTRLAEDRALRDSMGAASRTACQAYEISRVAVQYADAYAGLRNGQRPHA